MNESTFKIAIWTIALLTVSSAALITAKGATRVDSKSIELSPNGFCRSDAGSIDIGSLTFLKETSATLRSGSMSTIRVTIVRDTVVIDDVAKPNAGEMVYNVSAMVSKGEDPDLSVHLVLLSDDLAIYWRETFQNRQYRQGVFTILEGRLVQSCEGIGGISTSH